MRDASGHEVDPREILDNEELAAYLAHEPGRMYHPPRLRGRGPVEPWADLLAEVGQA